MTISRWFVFGSWLVLLGYWLISAVGAKKSARRSWRSDVRVRLPILLAIVFLLRIPGFGRFFRSIGQHGALPGIAGEILGVALCMLGIGSAIWARAHLGRNWGLPRSINENPDLVITGPYAYVRHPIYAGVWVAALGSGIAQSVWWVVPVIFFGAYFLFSARVEEKTMMRCFPDEYRAYMKRTKMFIPFVL